ncbi:disease resistance protein RPM1-like [Rhodamnia argentea]|uniref:Disease resistance protein RPM1-like n=1 Tax=Rhodamnia argentea TaxID=178133 RepID=A0A8B8QRT0_9MYRT|nr:disease resistance protein RPM1-like [Rhodamnia argentea]
MSSRFEDIRIKIQNFGDLEYLRAGNTASGEGRCYCLLSEDHLAHRVIEEDNIVGFDDHVERIRDQFLSGEPRLSTISILGAPGSGKTVLAKQQKRFVVVLDDIWRTQDWELIVNELQIGSSGSTVMVTSRNSDVGASCVGYPKYVHKLNGLPWKKALSLFCEKASRNCNGICPLELEDWSEKIIKKCEGLPLPVIAAGNLLSKKRQIPYGWKKLHDCLGANLPWQRLIRLCIAEGFVKEARNVTLEEIAEHFLNELVRRNLVHVTVREIDGWVRRCHVLNLVHEFIIAKAEEENFVGSASERSSSSQGRIRHLSAKTNIDTNVELGETLGHIRYDVKNYMTFDGAKGIEMLSGRGALSNQTRFRVLQHLYLKGQLQKLPKWVSSLQSLIKVGLKWSRLRINPLQTLQDLPNLMELNMVDAFKGANTGIRGEHVQEVEDTSD